MAGSFAHRFYNESRFPAKDVPVSTKKCFFYEYKRRGLCRPFCSWETIYSTFYSTFRKIRVILYWNRKPPIPTGLFSPWKEISFGQEKVYLMWKRGHVYGEKSFLSQRRACSFCEKMLPPIKKNSVNKVTFQKRRWFSVESESHAPFSAKKRRPQRGSRVKGGLHKVSA